MTDRKNGSQPLTFLENGFPVEGLHELALAEGNSKRPIYQIHKWWARRLGSVFRTLLISSFLSPHESYRNFWHNYYNGFALENTVVYDPMMGGGTSVVEALRLGCKVIGSDINPVAWFVTKKEIERFDEDVVDGYFQNLEDAVGKKTRKFYETTCLEGHKCESRYALWIRRMNCSNCKKESDLFNSLLIRHDRHNKEKDVFVCPKCDGVFYTKQTSKSIECSLCKSHFNRNYNTVHAGIFHCPSCGKKERVIDKIKKIKKPLETRMFCIEFDCEKCGLGFKAPDKHDLELYQNVKRIFIRNTSKLEFPKQKIPFPEGSDKRPVSNGFLYYHDLFNQRQLLTLSILLNEIKKIPDENAKEFLLLAFSSSLETNNALCKYETNWGKISALFGMPAFHIPERYGENNLWGNGRGSFPRTYRKLKRGKKYALNTYEVLHKDRTLTSRNRRKFTGESAITSVSKNYSEFLLPEQKVQLLCRDSSNMPTIKSKTVDIVVTDPPYFDTIQYSRLADFFYVWLRLGLKNSYSWFMPETSKRNNEVVAQEWSETSRDSFVSGLTRILKESHRVLKDDGMLVFTFHHTQKWAWSGLRKSLLDAGFNVTSTPIIRSEGRTGFRKGSNSTSYDVCVVCRKSEHTKPVLINFEMVLKDYVKTCKLIKKLDNSMRVSDIFTVIMSKYIMSEDQLAERIINNTKSISDKIILQTKIQP